MPSTPFTTRLSRGAGQGLGQLSGLTLLGTSVPTDRLAEANAAFNVGGYLPAGLLPVAVGYLSDAVGLTTGSTLFAGVLFALAAAGAVFVTVRRGQLAEPSPSPSPRVRAVSG